MAEQAPRHGWERGARTRAGDALAAARECQALLFDSGYAGISWPSEYGGRGLGIREQIAFNIASLDYDLPLAPYIIGLGMCGPTILAVGTDEQKERYVRPMLRGEEIWCQMFSEPGAGSDVAGLTTRAVLDGTPTS